MPDKMTIKEAREITGHTTGLGKTSKMPGFSTGIPAIHCERGQKLAKIPGSVCFDCYAMKGKYRTKSVKKGQARRYAALSHPRWIEGMVRLIGHQVDPIEPWFRIHDSGDSQSPEHVRAWAEIARRLPWVRFWMPSKELQHVKEAMRGVDDWPTNLVIRISAPLIGKTLRAWGLPTSSVDAGTGHRCPAYDQDGKCGPCRACWDPTVENVDYKKH